MKDTTGLSKRIKTQLKTYLPSILQRNYIAIIDSRHKTTKPVLINQYIYYIMLDGISRLKYRVLKYIELTST